MSGVRISPPRPVHLFVKVRYVDKTSWGKGKIEGDVYRKIVKGDLDMFFTPP